MRRAILFFCFCAALLALQGPAAAAKRVALVVGVDTYDNLPASEQLRKALNDARAVGDTLKGLGYEVIQAENVGRPEFLRSWQQFLNRIEPGDEVAFFYAGHGVEVGELNYLLPRDVPAIAPGEEQVLTASALSFNTLLDQVRERHPQVSRHIVDACRDNPYTKGRGIGGQRGLALVEPPKGTFVMYSASTEESALDRLSDDDPDPNSVYTRTLIPRLKTPGKSITEIARDVRRAVHELAESVNHVQTPAYYDEVIGDFCPAGCEARVAEAKPEAVTQPVPAAGPALPSQLPPAAETKPVDAPPASPQPETPPVQTAAALTPQAVQRPSGGHAPVQQCARLAADPDNPDSVARGVEIGDTIDQAEAIRACEEAVRLYPQERRFAFQLARAQFHAKKPELAKPSLEALNQDGYAIAGVYLGFMYANGIGVAKDEAEAARLFRQCADAGDALGAPALAAAYKDGGGVAKDEAEALRWLRRAANAGNARAMTLLGDQYTNGELGLAKSDAEAAAWYRKAAALGSARAWYDLALMYQEGRGLAKDQAEATRLFQLGDDLKSPSAMIHVGLTYDIGERVTKDQAESLHWYRKAADLGDPSGMSFVAMAYRYGNGVAENQAEAASWYRKAAELGEVTAMGSLADMYEKGEGVPQDLAEAKRWRAAAVAGGAPGSQATPASEESKEEEVAAVAPNESDVSPPAAQSGVLLRSFGPQEVRAASIAFSGDGKQILGITGNSQLELLDTITGNPKYVSYPVGTNACCGLALSPDGKEVASFPSPCRRTPSWLRPAREEGKSRFGIPKAGDSSRQSRTTSTRSRASPSLLTEAY